MKRYKSDFVGPEDCRLGNRSTELSKRTIRHLNTKYDLLIKITIEEHVINRFRR